MIVPFFYYILSILLRAYPNTGVDEMTYDFRHEQDIEQTIFKVIAEVRDLVCSKIVEYLAQEVMLVGQFLRIEIDPYVIRVLCCWRCLVSYDFAAHLPSNL